MEHTGFYEIYNPVVGVRYSHGWVYKALQFPKFEDCNVLLFIGILYAFLDVITLITVYIDIAQNKRYNVSMKSRTMLCAQFGCE